MPRLSPLLELARRHKDDDMQYYGNLTNDVHPIFDKKRFSSDFDYDAFLPSLRLASRLLDTPQMLYFFFVVFYGEEQDTGLQYRNGNTAKAVRSDRRIHTLSKRDIAKVRRKLVEFADMLTFHVEELSPDIGAQCCCSPLHKRKGDPRWYSDQQRYGSKYPFPGSKCRVEWNRLDHDVIRGLGNGQTTIEQAHNLYFSAAVRVLHELGHAASAVQNEEWQDRFFQDSLILEAGFETEAHMFGCVRNVSDHRVFRIMEWPNAKKVTLYKQADQDLLVRDNQGLRRRRRNWFLPDYFSTCLLHDWFWDEMGKSIDARALVPLPVAQSIRDALRRGRRVPAPQAIADLFQNAAYMPGAAADLAGGPGNPLGIENYSGEGPRGPDGEPERIEFSERKKEWNSSRADEDTSTEGSLSDSIESDDEESERLPQAMSKMKMEY